MFSSFPYLFTEFSWSEHRWHRAASVDWGAFNKFPRHETGTSFEAEIVVGEEAWRSMSLRLVFTTYQGWSAEYRQTPEHWTRKLIEILRQDEIPCCDLCELKWTELLKFYLIRVLNKKNMNSPGHVQ